MGDFLNGAISNQIYFVYGMIGIVLFLIITLLVVDRKDKKKSKNQVVGKVKKEKHRGKELELDEELDLTLDTKEEVVEVTKKEELDSDLLETIIDEYKQEGVFPESKEEQMEVIEPVTKEEKEESSNIEQIEQPTIEEVEDLPKKEETEEIVYVEDDPELEKTQAQLELQRLTEELEKASQEEKAIDLTNFEVEQEENAIISMDELLKKGDALYDKNEVTQYMDEGNEPINLEELEKHFASSTPSSTVEESPVMEQIESVSPPPQTVEMNDFLKPEEEVKLQEARETKFKSTPIISPVFGLQPEQAESIKQPVQIDVKEELTPIEEIPTILPHPDQLALEQTANLEKFDEEIRKTNEFLHQLKELQKKLQ